MRCVEIGTFWTAGAGLAGLAGWAADVGRGDGAPAASGAASADGLRTASVACGAEGREAAGEGAVTGETAGRVAEAETGALATTGCGETGLGF